MVQTHNNLKNLNIEKMTLFLSPSEGIGHGVVWIKSQNSEGHSQIRLQCKDSDDVIDFPVETIYKKSLHPQYFDFKTNSWGRKKIEKIRMSTRYPFGFFYVWRYFNISVEYFVFPNPSGEAPLVNSMPEGEEQGLNRQLNGDDFSEHKNYVYGDSHKHIDWKAYARGRPLLTKKFEEGQRETVLIDMDDAKGNQERKARQVSKWIHDCDQEDFSYAVKIKNRMIPLGHGEKHKSSCLKFLASQRDAE